jgi:hypothetical protein
MLSLISGLGFMSDGGVSAVSFNGIASPFVQVGSNATVYAMVPDKATSGPITVTTPAGIATSATAFTVNPCMAGPVQTPVPAPSPKPAVQTFTPTTGKAGTKVTLTGSGFTGACAGRPAKAVFSSSPAQDHAPVPVAGKSGRISTLTYCGRVAPHLKLRPAGGGSHASLSKGRVELALAQLRQVSLLLALGMVATADRLRRRPRAQAWNSPGSQHPWMPNGASPAVLPGQLAYPFGDYG